MAMSTSAVLATIAATIAAVREQIADLEASVPAVARSMARGEVATPVALRLDELEVFLVRLQQIRDLLATDPRLAPIVDDHLGQRMRDIAAEEAARRSAGERRSWRANLWLALATMVIGAVLGWLLSGLASPSLLNALVGR